MLGLDLSDALARERARLCYVGTDARGNVITMTDTEARVRMKFRRDIHFGQMYGASPDALRRAAGLPDEIIETNNAK